MDDTYAKAASLGSALYPAETAPTPRHMNASLQSALELNSGCESIEALTAQLERKLSGTNPPPAERDPTAPNLSDMPLLPQLAVINRGSIARIERALQAISRMLELV